MKIKKIKYIIIIGVVAYIFVFPPKVKAEEKLSVYYLKDDNAYGEMLKINFKIHGTKNTAKKIFIVLDKLFNNVQNINYIPKNTKIINSERIGKDAYINLNKEILSYGGGSTYEIGLIHQILYNVFQFDVDTLTIFIENEKRCFPEGSLIYKYKKEDFEKNFKDSR